MTNDLPFSQASDNNKQAILEVLEKRLTGDESVLEIGGGTGQHAVYFVQHLSQLYWQSSDLASNLEFLNLRLAAANLPNLPLATELDVDQANWNTPEKDVIFSANSLHIMSADSVVSFFTGVGNCLRPGGLLIIYGPFRYGGAFTTESNARFDLWLKSRDSVSGIRDFEWVNGLAADVQLKLIDDIAMPANNQILVWKKQAG